MYWCSDDISVQFNFNRQKSGPPGKYCNDYQTSHVPTLHIQAITSIPSVKKLYKVRQVRLQLHGAIYRPDSFVFMLRYCKNLKAIRYESTSFNRIVADKSHRVIAA